MALLTKNNISIVFMESFEEEHRHPVRHIKVSLQVITADKLTQITSILNIHTFPGEIVSKGQRLN